MIITLLSGGFSQSLPVAASGMVCPEGAGPAQDHPLGAPIWAPPGRARADDDGDDAKTV